MEDINVNEITPVIEKKMTIKKGLTRLSVIKKQLESINDDMRRYAAWNNKKKHPKGDNKANVDKTLDQAQEYINSLYQQYNDLIAEYKKIKLAIKRTNLATKFTVAGVEMTIAEAVDLKKNEAHDGVSDLMQNFVNAYNYSVANAERDVEMYNNKYASVDNENDKKILLSDVSYFISKDKVKKTEDFISVFMTEVNGDLDEVNAITPLIFE